MPVHAAAAGVPRTGRQRLRQQPSVRARGLEVRPVMRGGRLGGGVEAGDRFAGQLEPIVYEFAEL